ncbi:MAG TPA: hypothetical protein VJH34_03135 [archaeon]|nr:hypothetical protein [archaeon]
MLNIVFGLVQLSAAAILFLGGFWLPKPVLFTLGSVLSAYAIYKILEDVLDD